MGKGAKNSARKNGPPKWQPFTKGSLFLQQDFSKQPFFSLPQPHAIVDFGIICEPTELPLSFKPIPTRFCGASFVVLINFFFPSFHRFPSNFKSRVSPWFCASFTQGCRPSPQEIQTTPPTCRTPKLAGRFCLDSRYVHTSD